MLHVLLCRTNLFLKYNVLILTSISITKTALAPTNKRALLKTMTNERLTLVQRRVVRLVSLGCTNKQVAAILGVSSSTVDNHRTRAMRRWGVRTSAELTRKALLEGVTSSDDGLTRRERERMSTTEMVNVLRATSRPRGSPSSNLAGSILRQKFQGLMESAFDAMLIVNSSGEILLINFQVETMFGYSFDELAGQPIEQLLPERYRQDCPRHRQQFFEERGSKRSMGAQLELYGRCKDGSEFPIEIQINKIESEEETVAVAAVRDVTEQKKAQANLR